MRRVPIVFFLALAASVIGCVSTRPEVQTRPATAGVSTADAAAGAALYPAPLGHQWGYIDRSGAVVLAPRFDEAYPFVEGRARVRIRDRWGFANPSGETVIAPEYDAVYDFSGERARVMRYVGGAVQGNERYGFVDPTGAVVIEPTLAAAYDYADGRAPVLAEAHAPLFGLPVMRRLGLWLPRRSAWLLLDPAGHVRGTVSQLRVLRFAGRRAPFQAHGFLPGVGGPWGYVDLDGTVVVEPQFEGAFLFRECLARVVQDGHIGFIDSTGAFVIPPRFEAAGDFSGGLAAFRQGDRWGYVDRAGVIVIPLRFEAALDFAEGLAVVQERGLFGYVRPDGALAIPARFTYAGSFRNGLAFVREGQRAGYIDATGAYVWRQPE
ncbi:MAG TPA: WG repeat-containing protein [Rubricoccaceae bacterium]|nr:WG repeat-containing protein [Rubricoccaceae bacterium]